METRPPTHVPDAIHHAHIALEVAMLSAQLAAQGTIYNPPLQPVAPLALLVTLLAPLQTPAYVIHFIFDCLV